MTHVLIAEDDFAISSNLQSYLERQKFQVETVYTGHAALHRVSVEPFDILLLDLGLPGLDGLAFLQRLRVELRNSMPVIIISARSGLDDRLAGFEHGADDYVVKPFALSELEARMRAVLKRAAGVMMIDPIRRFESLSLDTRSGEASINGLAIHLTPKAAVLLELLLRTPGQLVRRRKAEEALWPGAEPQPDALRSQIHWLRKALADNGFDRLETVHGVGYRIGGTSPDL